MNVRRGLRIIKKNKLAFILLLLVIMALSLMVTSVLVTVFDEQFSFKNERSKTKSYEAVPVSLDFNDLDTMIMDMNELLSHSGKSCFQSQTLNEKYNSHILIFVGDFLKDKDRRSLWAVSKQKDNIKDIHKKINNKVDYVKIDKMNIDINDFNAKQYNFYLSDYKNLMDYDINTNQLEDIIHNLNFSKSEIKTGIDLKLIKTFSDKSMNINLTVDEEKSNSEGAFILKFVFVQVGSLLLMLYLSYLIINRNLLYKMKNETIINIICGANVKDIFLQNSIFITLLNLINLVFLIYIVIHDKNIIAKKIVPILSLVEYLIFELILYLSIKNEHLEKYIGGES